MADPMDDSDLLFSSPSKTTDTPQREQPKTPSNKNAAPFDAEEVRDAALQRELEGVRNINEVIEGVIGTLERAKGNMGVGLLPFQAIYVFQDCGGLPRNSRPCRKQ